MKISRLIFFSIFSILLLFTITTYVNYTQSEEVRENAEFLAVSSNIVRQSNQFQRNILYMERGLKAYIITGENYLIQAYDSTLLENSSLLADLSTSISANVVQYKKLNEIKGLYNKWIKELARPVIISSSKVGAAKGRSATINQVLKSEDEVNNKLQQKFRELLSEEYKIRSARKLNLEKSEEETKAISFLLTAFSIVVGFFIAILLARHISTRILKMVEMANTIAKGNYKVQVKDKGNDELSELTRSLNHMAIVLEQNISLLKRKNIELDQFAHIVSHDLKAPLRGIDNVLSWIEEDHAHQIPVKVHEYLQLIKGRVNKSENLIQGILSYARIGKDAYDNELINTSGLVSEILETLPTKPGLKVTVESNMPSLNSEKVPLTQVFSNLISNAIKYHNKQKGQVNIFYKENNSYYEFFVQDDGVGIAESYHKKIFGIFQTLVQKDSFESTGVGLAIVKKILDDRNEQIYLTSQPGIGTTFSFTWKK